MIKQITVTNSVGRVLNMELANPFETGLAITSITGIGPGKADVIMNKNASIDGDIFTSARMPKRNIVIQLRYLGASAEDIERARKRSYVFFSPKKKIRLLFETDLRTCYIDGYVESNEPTIFSQKSGAQISILCPNPFFRSLEDQETKFYDIESHFKFEFSNESLSQKLINLSEIVNVDAKLVKYDGDADTGMIISFMLLSNSISNPTITNTLSGETIGFNIPKLRTLIGGNLQYGDVVEISTERGNKYCKHIRSGMETNALGCITEDSKWIQLLSNEEQVLRFGATSGSQNMRVSITNKILYEGV